MYLAPRLFNLSQFVNGRYLRRSLMRKSFGWRCWLGGNLLSMPKRWLKWQGVRAVRNAGKALERGALDGKPTRVRSQASQTKGTVMITRAQLHAAEVKAIKANAAAIRSTGTASEAAASEAGSLATADYCFLCDQYASQRDQGRQVRSASPTRVYNERPIGIHGWDFLIALGLALFAPSAAVGIVTFLLSLCVSFSCVIVHCVCRLIKRILQDRPYEEWFA